MGVGASASGEAGDGVVRVGAGPCRDDAFSLRVEDDGTTLRLCVTGEFDWACVGDVEAALERVDDSRVERVVLDLQRLTFMDLAGLKTILRANERGRTTPFELVVVRPRGHANRVFTLTRASKGLTLVDHVSAPGIGG